MREIIPPQLQLGEQDISAIEIDCRSRDDIPRLLCGLQYIYTSYRHKVTFSECLEFQR